MKKSLRPLSVTLADIESAREKLKPFLKPTPLLYNAWLSKTMHCKVYLKMENMQPIGSFKIRGATHKILNLTDEEKERGVIAASAGNHAQGVAWASHQTGVKATIVMPTTAPLVKVENTRMLGAEVALVGETYDEAFAHAQMLSRKSGAVFIHAFEDQEIIAGQGTVGLELLSQLSGIDAIISSVGGGGLIGGVATVFKAIHPNTRMIGCQALKAPSMIESIRKGKAVKLSSAETFADGICIYQASEKMRRLLDPLVDDWVGIGEDAIAAAVLTLLEKGKILAEGAGAVPLAALEKIQKKLRNKTVVLIVSGGNIDVNVLSRIVDAGLVRTGRRVRVNVMIPDRPGALAKLTQIIAQEGANILQTIHDRSEPSAKLYQTEIELTLETRGPEHSATLIDTLKNNVLRLELLH